MTRIFNDNDFEGMKLYEENTETNKVVAKQLKKIFTRLFHDTDVNVDDFYFTIFEDDSPNAFFCDKKYTTDKNKNVIAISRGLVDCCQNEDEMAGIIGHECGHYLWSELLGGKNSIFQEHAADLRAVDLLIHAGYNPIHHLNVCERLFSDYGRHRYSDATLDVHGNGLARVEDIKAYLTKIANEKGYFKDVKEEAKDPEYEKFKSEFKAANENELYTTYVDDLLNAKFNTTDVSKIKTADLLNLFTDEIKNNRITYDIPVRFHQMLNCVRASQYLANGKEKPIKRYSYKTDEDVLACQDFLMTAYINFNTAKRRYLVNYNILDDDRRRITDLASTFELEPFGDFVTQYENIKNFVNYKDKEDAVFWAKKMYDLQWTQDFYHFKYPYLKPREENSIGRKHPWNELLDYAGEYPADSEEAKALMWAAKVVSPENTSRGDLYMRENFERFDEDFYFMDDNKVVILYGPEAKQKNIEKRNAAAEEQADRTLQLSMENNYNKLNYLNALAEYHTAKSEDVKSQALNKIKEILKESGNYPEDLIRYGLDKDFNSPSCRRRPKIDEFLANYEGSLAKKTFVSDDDSQILGIEKIQHYNEYNRVLAEINNSDELSDYEKGLYKQQIIDKTKISYMNSQFSISSNIKLRENIFSALTEVLAEMDDEKDKKAILEQMREITSANLYITPDYELDDAQRKISKIERERFNKLKDVLTNKYIESSTTSLFYVADKTASSIYRKTAESLKFNEPDYLLERFAKKQGLTDVRNLQQIFKDVGEILYASKSSAPFRQNYVTSVRSYYPIENDRKSGEFAHFWDYFGMSVVANAMKYDDNFELPQVMKYIKNSTSDSYISQKFADVLAERVEQADKFNKLSLKDKIFVYEVMNEKNIFSENKANKQEYFEKIVDDIENCPDHDKAMEYAEKLMSKQYITLEIQGFKNTDIPFSVEKDRLIEFYAKGKAQLLEKDDGSKEFFEKAEKVAEDIAGNKTTIRYGNTFSEQKFPDDTLNAILDKISTKVVSQAETAEMFAEKGLFKVSGEDATKYDMAARSAQALISLLAKSPELAKSTITFLSHKCTDDSIKNFLESKEIEPHLQEIIQISGERVGINKASLKMVHDNFWNVNLEARAYIMNSVLKAYSQKDEDILNLVVDMNFEKNSPYYKEANRVVRTSFKHLKKYEKNLILAALVASNQKDADDKQSMSGEKIGEGLKMFFENKGPAFVKFGQLLSYLPVLDKDIRRPLAKLRDKADIPSRDKLFKMMNETMPNSELKKISHVGKILGAGSFFISVQVKYDNKDCVLSVMRPHAKELVTSGMDMITSVIDDLSQQNPDYKPLKNIARQASLSSQNETDIEKDYKKSVEAAKIYDDLVVITPTGEFKPEVAKWESYGSGKDGQVYKVMNMAQGEAMTSDNISVGQKRNMAIAYTTIELCNLLSGQKWDTDRHQGQQNFAEKSDGEGFKKFVIGIFDTGAQMENSPKLKDKVLLGEILYGMARAARTGKNISDYMLEKVKAIDKAGNKLNFNTLYVDEVQRGLTALSDVMTYQKERKDKNGKVIQEEKSLTAEDMQHIVTAILNSGLVDKKVKTTIKVKAILNKLRPLRTGWLSSLSEGLHKSFSDIKIVKREKSQPMKILQPTNKPEAEIAEINANKKAAETHGVDVRHIKSGERQ